MAVSAAAVTVANTATELTSAPVASVLGTAITVRNPSTATQTVFIGGSGVDTTNGFPLAAGDTYSATLGAADRLYGIVASGTQSVNVVRVGV